MGWGDDRLGQGCCTATREERNSVLNLQSCPGGRVNVIHTDLPMTQALVGIPYRRCQTLASNRHHVA